MKTERKFTIKYAIGAGIIVELMLVLIQFVYLKFYTGAHTDADFAFTSEYMNTGGFYIFQIFGFFLYSIIIFYIIRNFQIKNIVGILVFLGTGGIIEVLFYVFSRADYQIAYFFSVLDKFIAALIGAILYFCSLNNTVETE
jgi:hypothetical protein